MSAYPDFVVDMDDVAIIVIEVCMFLLFDESTFLMTQNLFNRISIKTFRHLILEKHKYLLGYFPVDLKICVYLGQLRIKLYMLFASSPRM